MKNKLHRLGKKRNIIFSFYLIKNYLSNFFFIFKYLIILFNNKKKIQIKNKFTIIKNSEIISMQKNQLILH